MTVVEQPLADPLQEAMRITDAADRSSLTLRVMGGVAVALRCPSARQEPLRREYGDLDVVGLRSERAEILRVFDRLGYRADEDFNLYNGQTRLLFDDEANGRHVDVFLDPLDLCHRLSFADRLKIDERTLSLSDLLLSKLQIVETNHKDLTDMVALLADHDVGAGEDGLNATYLSELAANDWGLWRTMTGTLSKVGRFLSELGGQQTVVAAEKVQLIFDAFELVPKSRHWRLRAKLGERKRWYALPEELD